MQREEESENFRIKEEVLVAKRAEYKGKFYENPRQGSHVRVLYFVGEDNVCVEQMDVKRPRQYLIAAKCLEGLAPSDDEIQEAIESILNKSPKEDT